MVLNYPKTSRSPSYAAARKDHGRSGPKSVATPLGPRLAGALQLEVQTPQVQPVRRSHGLTSQVAGASSASRADEASAEIMMILPGNGTTPSRRTFSQAWRTANGSNLLAASA